MLHLVPCKQTTDPFHSLLLLFPLQLSGADAAQCRRLVRVSSVSNSCTDQQGRHCQRLLSMNQEKRPGKEEKGEGSRVRGGQRACLSAASLRCCVLLWCPLIVLAQAASHHTFAASGVYAVRAPPSSENTFKICSTGNTNFIWYP